MKRFVLAVLLAGAVLVAAGCTKAAGAPKAVVPEDQVNFGDVPVVTDMSKAKVKQFTIKNEGGSALKLSNLQVKTLEGCWPPTITVGTAVINPGQSTSFNFPYAMHPGMGGKHHFEVHLKTNDPSNPELVFHVRANSIENK